jgi:hypothetical protein
LHRAHAVSHGRIVSIDHGDRVNDKVDQVVRQSLGAQEFNEALAFVL